MIHHERVKPPPHVYPADEWNLIEKQYMPHYLEMMETVFTTANGYLGMRGGFGHRSSDACRLRPSFRP